jgi:C4-dicarboxylate-specific signal transduction histidine kinase
MAKSKTVRTITAGARMQDGRLEMIGSVQDITESKLAEEALNQARGELAHVARVATLNAMTASIAHEVA